jgi:hypothetical protein
MQSILAFIAVMVGIGIFARSFNGKVRLLLFLMAAFLVVYVTLK